MARNTDIRARLFVDNSGLRKGISESEGVLSGFAGKAGTAMKGAAAVAAVTFTKAFLDGMNQQQLAAKFGEDIAESSAAVYRNAWGESLEEVATQMRDVQAGLGDAGNIEKMTEAAFILEEKFGRDVGGTIQDVTELVDSFGLQGEAAFDLWATALDGMTSEAQDELSAATREYGDFFAGLGLRADETLALFAHFGEGGAERLDKVGDAMKELTIRGTDMSSTSAEAFEIMGKDQQLYADLLLEGGDAARDALFGLIRGLQDIEDPSQQAAAAVALFGSPIEDLGVEQIPEFLESVYAMRGGLEVTEGAVAAMGDQLSDNLGTKLEAIKRQGLGALADLMEQRVIPVVEDVIATVQEHWPKIQEVIGQATDWVGEKIDQYWPGIRDTIGQASQYVFDLIEEHWPTVRDTIVEVVEVVGEKFDEYWPVIKDVVQSVTETIVGLVEEHWPQIKEIIVTAVETVQAVIDRVLGIIQGIWERWGDEILTVAERTWEFVEQAISGALDIIQGVFRTFKALFEGDWGAMWDGIKQVVDGALTLITGAASAIWDAVKAGAEEGWELVKTAVSDAVGALPDLILGFGETILRAGRGLLLRVRDGAVEALSTAWEWIKGWVTGLPSDITNLGVSLAAAASDLFWSVVDKAEEILGMIPGIITDKILGPLQSALNTLGLSVGIADTISAQVNAAIEANNNIAAGESTSESSDTTTDSSSSSTTTNQEVPGFAVGGVVTQAMADRQNFGFEPDVVLAKVHVGETVIPPGGNGAPLIGVVNMAPGRTLDDELRLAQILHGAGA